MRELSIDITNTVYIVSTNITNTLFSLTTGGCSSPCDRGYSIPKYLYLIQRLINPNQKRHCRMLEFENISTISVEFWTMNLCNAWKCFEFIYIFIISLINHMIAWTLIAKPWEKFLATLFLFRISSHQNIYPCVSGRLLSDDWQKKNWQPIYQYDSP